MQKTSPWLIATRVLFTFALIACIVFIFSNSLQIADVSEGASGRVLGILQGILRHLGLPGAADRLTMHIVRKLAHFCEYLLEGFLLMLCLRVYTRHFVRHMSWPILGGLLTALTDETIQLFSPGRSSQVLDVWLDFMGVLAGLLVGSQPLGLADVGLYPGYFAGAGCRGAKFLGVRQRASQAGPERQTPPRRVQLAPVNYNTGRAFP